MPERKRTNIDSIMDFADAYESYEKSAMIRDLLHLLGPDQCDKVLDLLMRGMPLVDIQRRKSTS